MAGSRGKKLTANSLQYKEHAAEGGFSIPDVPTVFLYAHCFSLSHLTPSS
jgi:hypothetical protein